MNCVGGVCGGDWAGGVQKEADIMRRGGPQMKHRHHTCLFSSVRNQIEFCTTTCHTQSIKIQLIYEIATAACSLLYPHVHNLNCIAILSKRYRHFAQTLLNARQPRNMSNSQTLDIPPVQPKSCNKETVSLTSEHCFRDVRNTFTVNSSNICQKFPEHVGSQGARWRLLLERLANETKVGAHYCVVKSKKEMELGRSWQRDLDELVIRLKRPGQEDKVLAENFHVTLSGASGFNRWGWKNVGELEEFLMPDGSVEASVTIKKRGTVRWHSWNIVLPNNPSLTSSAAIGCLTSFYEFIPRPLTRQPSISLLTKSPLMLEVGIFELFSPAACKNRPGQIQC